MFTDKLLLTRFCFTHWFAHVCAVHSTDLGVCTCLLNIRLSADSILNHFFPCEKGMLLWWRLQKRMQIYL